MNKLLEVEHLEKSIANSEFKIKDISFEVNEGETVALIGNNGSGKSTTIKTIMGDYIKDSGVIKFFGDEVGQDDYTYKNSVGVVFDELKLTKKLPIGRVNSIMKAMYESWHTEQFLKLLNFFNLPENRRVETLSRGMSMKLAIAIALSHDSRLLILDEATAGLDASSREQVLELLEDFVDQGNGIVLSSHISEDIETIADRLVFLRDGAIVMNVRKQELYDDYGIVEMTTDEFNQIDSKSIYAYQERKGHIKALVNKNTTDYKVKHINNIDQVTKILMRGETV
ncbi:ABC transporter ATP-binding protein [Staphylococcus sp. 18_1_E_LY]|uniref:ABC transporter ATP-binding protein n=1 Tax=Staphylococcus lloydii TaxID=2781774 RepID=A0A7T1B0Q3_9STAP|nr:ABC transporter ATP-binding protein [Staphylococcus lloydii]MBF7020270.1 ABC transporter ATP-binding protein [Staphylococcus lloydii]MBF7027953.1 ABC transporter ATP-binding protein [Staphylococcus lloydii]QPM75620.1 ABC transporter ATP-binding protein [Staphylococcus lloydii]